MNDQFLRGLSYTSAVTRQPDNVRLFAHVLRKWRKKFDYSSLESDHVAVFLHKIVGIPLSSIPKFVNTQGQRRVLIDLARFLGMSLDEVLALTTFEGFPGYHTAPTKNFIKAGDVAETLERFLLSGRVDWMWYHRACFDEDSPTIEEFSGCEAA